MLGVCYFPKIWLLLQHLTNCSGWSICSEIPWSISAGIGGQFIPNSGGQYHRNLHLEDFQANGLDFLVDSMELSEASLENFIEIFTHHSLTNRKLLGQLMDTMC